MKRLLLPFVCFVGLIPAAAADRVALVIGNNQYTNLPDNRQLTSPVADATDVAAALKALGYTLVTGRAVTDASRDAMTTATESFATAARGAEAAVFYFSGHGVQVGEDNYLLPSDAPRLTGISILKNRSVLLRDSVMVALEETGARNKVIILDCCRDNPFAAQLETALAQVGKSIKTKSVGEISGYGPGFYLAFATSPGFTADDGNGERNSPFTAALLKTLPASADKDIDFFFRDVKTLLGGGQVSWTNHSLTASFALARSSVPAMPAIPRQPDPILPPDPLRSASRDRPFVNSLGMEFIPVPGKPGLLMCRTETRVRDFRAYANAADYVQSGGIFVMKATEKGTSWELDSSASWEKPGFTQSEEHPVVGVSWNEAHDFLAWLSRKEGRTYRLPSDEEWSAAVGVGKHPWGSTWPPPKGVGNYAGAEWAKDLPGKGWPTAYDHSDGYARTAPAASFAENKNGFYDLGGNVWEWCEDKYRSSMNSPELLKEIPALKEETSSDGTPHRVLRGGSWNSNASSNLLSSYRNIGHPTYRLVSNGFRCVVVVSGG